MVLYSTTVASPRHCPERPTSCTCTPSTKDGKGGEDIHHHVVLTLGLAPTSPDVQSVHNFEWGLVVALAPVQNSAATAAAWRFPAATTTVAAWHCTVSSTAAASRCTVSTTAAAHGAVQYPPRLQHGASCTVGAATAAVSLCGRHYHGCNMTLYSSNRGCNMALSSRHYHGCSMTLYSKQYGCSRALHSQHNGCSPWRCTVSTMAAT
jgi:hypothetical protein